MSMIAFALMYEFSSKVDPVSSISTGGTPAASREMIAIPSSSVIAFISLIFPSFRVAAMILFMMISFYRVLLSAT